MDTRWRKYNRAAEQQEEWVQHGAWWVTWPAEGALMVCVVWTYANVLSEMTADVRKAML